ncbi:37S ribosomal protein S23 mitochondrial [Ascosphaera pollenicola]|nr:37S ribosomal protein S23 mitochondrial [Ascosphaera pollenicola]
MSPRLNIPVRRQITTLTKLLFFGTSVFCGHIVSQRWFYLNGAWGPSMYPTLAIEGQVLLGSMRYKYGKGIQVGDVIIYNNPLYINDHVAKRVIGMPGDLVLCNTPPGDDRRHPNELMVEVPEGHVWVTGDNLPWSRDSRAYGPVPLGLVKGKLLATGNSPFSWTRVRNTLEPTRFADDE